jgi:dihydrofolate reductase
VARVVGDISMSLDGFVTGPGADTEHGLGLGAETLHTWATNSTDPVDRAVLAGTVEHTGAVVMGRKLFDVVDGPLGWSDEMGYGATHAARPRFFVVTSARPDAVRLDLDFTFVTGGPSAAVSAATVAALGKDVIVMGGGETIGTCLQDGLLDELRIHLAPIVLGFGTPLFRAGPHPALTQREVTVSSTATHLVYDVGDRPPVGAGR